MTAFVTYADAKPSGLAEMIGGLIAQNLVRVPARERLLRPALIAIAVPDAGVAVSLRVDPGRVLVADGPEPSARLRIAAASDRLLALAAAPLRWGLPDVLEHEGRAVLADLLRRRVRIHGLFSHAGALRRLTMLLSAR
jgi:hypothetical protein